MRVGKDKVDKSERTMRRGPRRLGRWVAVGLLATLVTACGGGSTSGSGSGGDSGSGGGSGGGTDEVTFLNILPMESLTYTPEMVADACGHFKEQGLNVTFETTQGSAQAIQTVIAGSALLARVGDIEAIIAAADKNAPVSNVGTVQHRQSIRIVSSTRAPIKDADDFRGKLIGIPSEGGTSEITLDLVLNSAGINPEDVNRQVVGLTPGVFNLVKSGRIDAYVVSLDTAVALKQQQPDAVIFNPSEAINAGAQLYLTSQQQLEDPQAADMTKRYLAAIHSAVQSVVEDESNGFKKTMECISSKYNVPTLDTPKVARESLSSYVDIWTANGSDWIVKTKPEQWQVTYQEMVSAGLVDEGMDPQNWYTNELAPGGE